MPRNRLFDECSIPGHDFRLRRPMSFVPIRKQFRSGCECVKPGFVALTGRQIVRTTQHVSVTSVVEQFHAHPVCLLTFLMANAKPPGVRLVVVLSDSYRHGPGAVKSE